MIGRLQAGSRQAPRGKSLRGFRTTYYIWIHFEYLQILTWMNRGNTATNAN